MEGGGAAAAVGRQRARQRLAREMSDGKAEYRTEIKCMHKRPRNQIEIETVATCMKLRNGGRNCAALFLIARRE